MLALATAAATASELDLVGVDLLPRDGGWVVLELNGAADFTHEYAPARDAFAATLSALARVAYARRAALVAAALMSPVLAEPA